MRLACIPLLYLLLALLAVAPPVQAGGDTLVVIVRHAEKAKVEGGDPPLSAQGDARAERLAQYLAGLRLRAAYSTDYRRTHDTALPAARAAGIAVGRYPAQGDGLAGLIRSRHAGEAVLVVGHNNTVPAIVAALSGHEVAPIDDDEYDRLYLVALPADGPTRLLEARY